MTASRRHQSRRVGEAIFRSALLVTILLTIVGLVSMRQMPSGIYPEVAFPRIVVIAQTPGLAVKDVEVTVTRPIEEAVSIVLGVTRVRSKTVRGAAELSIDFAPTTDMVQALNDVRARMAEVGAQLPAGTTTITNAKRRRYSRSFRSSSPAAATRRRCTTMHITTCGRGSAAYPMYRMSPCKAATSAKFWSTSNQNRWWRPACRFPTWPTASAKNIA